MLFTQKTIDTIERVAKEFRQEIEEAKDFANWLSKKGFTDGVDANPVENLIEYGCLRNPETGITILCTVCYESKIVRLDYTVVDIDDVKEALKEMPDGFFDMIDNTLDSILENLEQKNLASLIHDMNMYIGYFSQSCTWEHSVESLKNIVK